MYIDAYSDEQLVFDEYKGQYRLTAKAILDNLGIDLSGAMKDNANGTTAILWRISALVYKKIHEYNSDTEWQDSVIAHTETGRRIIKDAMLDQFLYVKTVGDLSMSTDVNKRACWFSTTTEEILFRVIPEIGTSICTLTRY